MPVPIFRLLIAELVTARFPDFCLLELSGNIRVGKLCKAVGAKHHPDGWRLPFLAFGNAIFLPQRNEIVLPFHSSGAHHTRDHHVATDGKEEIEQLLLIPLRR